MDSTASVKNCYTYDPWGIPVGNETSETFFNPYRFAGYFWDDEVSQYHCFRRQYDPVLARFTSRDIVAGKFKEPLTLHKYLYCQNDPLNRTDPSGEFAGLANVLVSNAILSSLRKIDFGFSMALWDKSYKMGQLLNMMQISKTVEMELLLAEMESTLTEAGVNAIFSFITPYLETTFGKAASFAGELLGDVAKEDITKLLKDPSAENFWLYFLGKVPGTLEE